MKKIAIILIAAFYLWGSSAWAASSGQDGLIMADTLREWLSQSRDTVAVFDVRPPSEYLVVSIPGSINVDAYAIKTKQFARNKKVVLVGRAMAMCMLLSLREQLKSQGFERVYVLSGGIGSWAPDKNRLALTGANRQLLAAAMACPNLNVTVSDIRSEKQYNKRHVPGAVNIEVDIDSPDFEGQFKKMIDKTISPDAGKDPQNPLVLVDEAGKLARILVPVLKQRNRPFTYFLTGGAFQWFLLQDYPPKQVHVREGKVNQGCPTCPN